MSEEKKTSKRGLVFFVIGLGSAAALVAVLVVTNILSISLGKLAQQVIGESSFSTKVERTTEIVEGSDLLEHLSQYSMSSSSLSVVEDLEKVFDGFRELTDLLDNLGDWKDVLEGMVDESTYDIIVEMIERDDEIEAFIDHVKDMGKFSDKFNAAYERAKDDPSGVSCCQLAVLSEEGIELLNPLQDGLLVMSSWAGQIAEALRSSDGGLLDCDGLGTLEAMQCEVALELLSFVGDTIDSSSASVLEDLRQRVQGDIEILEQIRDVNTDS